MVDLSVGKKVLSTAVSLVDKLVDEMVAMRVVKTAEK